jgi:hypothetical protein
MAIQQQVVHLGEVRLKDVVLARLSSKRAILLYAPIVSTMITRCLQEVESESDADERQRHN